MALKSAVVAIKRVVEKIHHVHVKLHPNHLKDVEGTYVARTAREATLSISDVAAALKNRGGYTGNVNDLISGYEQLMAEVKYQLCDGFAVNLGIATIFPSVGGTWEHPNEVNDREKHPVVFKMLIHDELSRISAAIILVCDGVAKRLAYIDEVKDVRSGMVNATLTPGGAIVITGKRIKIAGDKPELGVFIEDSAGVRTKLEPPYAGNSVSKVIALLPAALPPGEYKLEIVTQYAGSKILNDARIIQMDTALTVVSI
jgi:hypothetical protein